MIDYDAESAASKRHDAAWIELEGVLARSQLPLRTRIQILDAVVGLLDTCVYLPVRSSVYRLLGDLSREALGER